MKGLINKTYSYRKMIKNIDIIKELEKIGITGNMSGKNYMLCCPIHGEKNPSFGINIKDPDKKGICRCLSCGWSGSFFSFLAYIKDVSLETILNKYKNNDITIKELNEIRQYLVGLLNNKTKNKNNNIKYYKIDFLNKFKKPYGPYLDYLIKIRKLNNHVINKFKIKCCDGTGTGYAKIWNKRIIIPIIDYNKKLAGITARSIIPGINKKDKVRKLIDSDASKVLFGLINIKKGSPLIGVEGEIDVIYLQKFFVPAIRTGKNPSKAMIKIIMEFTDKFIYCPDGDVKYINNDPKLYFDSVKFIRNKINKYISTDLILLPDDMDSNNLNEKAINKYFGNYINKNYFTKEFLNV